MPADHHPALSPLQELKRADAELSAARAAGDPRRLAYALAACAELWNDGGAVKRAHELYSECLPLVRAHGTPEDLPKVLCSMLPGLLQARQPHLALVYGLEALELFTAQRHALGIASTLINLADVQRELGHLAEARDGLTKAAELLQGGAEPELRAMTLVNLSVALAALDDFAAAQLKLHEARRLAERHRLPHMYANIDGLLELYRRGELPGGVRHGQRVGG
jgi:hypothetical protein